MPANILYVLSVSERGGAERIVESWTSNHSSDFRAHVVVPSDGPVAQTLRNLGVHTVVPRHFRIRSLYSAVRFLKEYIKAERIDLIHSSMPKAHLFGGLAALRTGCPEIWFHHGPLSSARYQGLIPLIPSAAVLVASRYMQDVQSPTLCGAKAIKRIPYGMDIDALTPNAANRARLRTQHDLADDVLCIGMFGRLIQWKGQHIVVEALRLCRERHPHMKFHCFFIGGTLFGQEPEYRENLETAVARHHLREHVTFTGHVHDVYPLYDMADVVIHASTIPEPFGLVVSEAMAKEKLVVATHGGGPSEMIKEGETGFLYPAADAAKLAAILLDIYEKRQSAASREGLRAMAARARASIAAEYSIAGSVMKLESVYREIIAEN